MYGVAMILFPLSLAASIALAPLPYQAAPSNVLSAEPTRAMWIELTPKPLPNRAIAADDTLLTPRALERRSSRRTLPGIFDARDLPIAFDRIASLRATGAKIRTQSRWLNAVSITATDGEIRAIAHLPFVAAISPLHRSHPADFTDEKPIPTQGGIASLDYGETAAQLLAIDIPSLHMRGLHGEGIIIGILDTGFNRVHEAFHSTEHPLDVIAEWDFVSNDGNTGIQTGDDPNQHKHGTWVLGTIAAYLPGSAIGGAFAAKFVLTKTEVYATETIIEEDYYVAGLEFIEAHGADLATSSLGYIDWYTPEMLDGLTAITTRAVNIATANGLVCITSAGNGGHDADPVTHTILAPADAFNVISCGASNINGTIAGFSSDGPTADGRIKPEILAPGVSVATVNSTNPTGLAHVSGTSFSAPLTAAATALLLQARVDLSVAGVRSAFFTTASDFVATGATDPLFVRGYGVISALAAAQSNRDIADVNFDGRVDATDLTILLSAWGPCALPDPATGVCITDFDADGSIAGQDLARILSAWGS